MAYIPRPTWFLYLTASGPWALDPTVIVIKLPINIFQSPTFRWEYDNIHFREAVSKKEMCKATQFQRKKASNVTISAQFEKSCMESPSNHIYLCPSKIAKTKSKAMQKANKKLKKYLEKQKNKGAKKKKGKKKKKKKKKNKSKKRRKRTG